jgi:hypothetical protein
MQHQTQISFARFAIRYLEGSPRGTGTFLDPHTRYTMPHITAGRPRHRVWFACVLVVTLVAINRNRSTKAPASVGIRTMSAARSRHFATPSLHSVNRDECPFTFKNISCAAYNTMLEDVRRGSLRACMEDVNTAHHPRQLSAAHQPALLLWDRECPANGRQPLFAFTSSTVAAKQRFFNNNTYTVFVEMEPPDVTGARPLAQPGFASGFDLVLSLVDASQYYAQPPPRNVIQWPYGSSSIPRDHWGTTHPKTKLCSIIVSDKNNTVGHQLRHRVVAMLSSEFAGVCDTLGRGYRPIDSKMEGLSDYMFTIVIENSRHSMYMTEKLMDAALLGVVPIYWGSRFAEAMFQDGILAWDTMDQLKHIVRNLSVDAYAKMQTLLRRNFNVALHFVPPEQWLWENVIKCVYEWHLANPPPGCLSKAETGATLPLSVFTGLSAQKVS